MKKEEMRYLKAYQTLLKESSGQELIFCLGCEKCRSDETRQHITTIYSNGGTGESFAWIETGFIKALGFYSEHLCEELISPKKKRLKYPVMLLKPWMD